MTQIGSEAPKGFGFFTGLCIVLGAIGVLGNSVLLFVSIANGSASEIALLAPAWMSALNIGMDSLQIYCGIQVRKHVNWARMILIALASISLLQLLYNTASLLFSERLSISATTISYFMIPLFIDSSIIYYFSRQTVKDFVKGSA